MTAPPLTRFIGRRRDVTEIRRLLGESRLLSLVGPGGSGKTRLAREICTGPDTAWVMLAEVEAAQAGPAVLDALGVAEVPGRSLADLIGHRSLLLVLDNCEHLVEAVAELAVRLLRDCPGLSVLTTTREPLAVAGEHVWWVDGLPGAESMQLFADRARRVAPGFTVGDGNADAVARLCRRLDGMPLALELAAARVRMLPPQRILDRLDDAFGLLVTADRDVPARHATLRAALDWSYDLLPPPERDLFARLAVFRGGFTLDAAEAVGGPDALPLLARLVDKSLVQAQADGDTERYRLLDVVRQYASSLGPAGPAEHARYYTALAERADARLTGAGQELWLDRLRVECDNMRSAFVWAHEHDPATAIRLAAALGRYHRLRGRYAEGGERLRAALDLAGPDTPPALLAKALAALGTLEFLQCAYEPATAHLDRAVTLLTRAGDRRGAATALQNLGGIAREQGRYADARARHEQSLDIWRDLGDSAGTARAIKSLSFTAWVEGDYARAAPLAADALRRFRELGDAEGMVGALVDLGAATLRGGDPAGARPLLREALALSRRLGSDEGIAWATEQLGLAALALGEREEARGLLRDALTVHHGVGDRWRTAGVLDVLAGLVTDARTAAVLLSAAAAARTEIGTPLPPCDRLERERGVRAVASRLGPGEWERAVVEGRASTLPRAVELALAASDPPPSAGPPAAPVPANPRVDAPGAAPAGGTEDAPAVSLPQPSGPRSRGPAPVGGVAPASVGGVAPASVGGHPPGRLVVHALGRARVLVGDRRLGPEDWTYAKPRELLYHLLTHPGATKDEIGAALWPEAAAAELRNSFHTCLKHLRRALAGAATVRFTAGGYRLDGDVVYDVDTFLAAAGEDSEDIAALADAAGRYPGDFLTDVPAGDWADVPRDRLRRRYEQIMLTRGVLLGRERRFTEAAETFARLIEHDPLLEAAHRGLMRCHAALGNPARALRQYDDLVTLLHSQIGAPASPETRALHARLRHAMAA
ncbi:putative ATPase/DNA-binding SARP family transcriptional activator [Catenuloplanes nepalensis]|uniref:ATPase/DNA-binding SARP family transcriptional activator n=1 Tax=Catenuloplanes nepalensis TaxID=587533 RepID=A0ABT9ML05_9ACTN|nr:tetratricopeptide repeat protein [Catenuloplanes nepalensis]MDP9792101.1 putative ATPase/DNA-binding SARP family transcriptional activator [Catenuloplanes nepalensis]